MAFLIKLCLYCGTEILPYPKSKSKKYCNKVCTYSHLRASGHYEKLRLAKIGKPRPDAKLRMIEKNPMSNQITRDKVSAKLKDMGHKPRDRGGNGTGMTEPQRVLIEALIEMYPDKGFTPEGVLKTKSAREYMGLDVTPPHYKVDILSEQLKLAIEVDGGSHNSIYRRSQDRKKEKCLEFLGYKVLRFKNEEIVNNIGDVIAKISLEIL